LEVWFWLSIIYRFVVFGGDLAASLGDGAPFLEEEVEGIFQSF
jgi:hypothetical protein